ncbi:hypothetical protein R3P38DRAFT_3570456 [Favolaschia claudopus]|uniref:Uncharacterized protein n=2 Tax=Favolaschia claudopus TaxID=2862362 RepID=A0AAW0AS35_9AGAR
MTGFPLGWHKSLVTRLPFAKDFVCDGAAGFYIVTDEESVIFFDKDDEFFFWRATSHGFSAGVVFAELIVLRDVFGEQGTPESTAICQWFQDVIDTAVNERRDVRPKSDGTMVQLGYNAGPRKWVPDPVPWPCLLTSFPHSSELLPRQPEAYFTYGYSASYHKDPCYVSGVCGISLNVGRTVNPPPSPTLAMPGLRQTRSQTRAGSAPGQIDSTSEDFSKWPANGGGNFVDIVVHQAAGTLFAFNPAMGHGTTRLCGATNYLAAITFSSHIYKAFQLPQTGSIEAGDKAGDGNFD